jgi:hypothetical protein
VKLRRLFVFVTTSALALAGGCGGDDSGSGPDAAPALGGPRDPFPSLYCPGSPGCTGTGDNVFKVGGGRAKISPTLVETEWDDENGDGEWSSGESFTDVNNNGQFDAVWMAGFGNGRPATSIHHDLWVRAIVFEWNDIRVGLAVVDAVGWMINEMDATRELISDNLELDHVIIAATHVHEGPDTVGLWGKQELVSGTDLDYQQLVHQKTVEALTNAVNNLEAATMTIAQVDTVDESGNSKPYVGDGRDPTIIDLTMTIMQFNSVARPGETVATLINWSAHPEYSGSHNNAITSDYIGLLRDVVENGAEENTTRGLSAIPGLGGEVVYINGSVGGQIGPKNARPIGLDGNPIAEDGLEKSDALGRNLGRLALETITDSSKATDVTNLDLQFRTGRLDLAVDNTYYHVAGLVGVFDRQFHGHDETKPLGPNNVPYIESQVTYLQFGPVAAITAPGELHPELFVGGYDGSRTYGDDLVDPNNENPPPLAMAPQPPYLRDLMLMNTGVQYPLLFGLAEDFAGYIVPSYNYELDDNTPYIEEAKGDHYEETNSVGPLVEDQGVGSMRRMIQWRPE